METCEGFVEQCENCGFFKPDNPLDGCAYGYCRRYAPRPAMDVDLARPDWPRVTATEWCGEWGMNAERLAEYRRGLFDGMRATAGTAAGSDHEGGGDG